MEKSDFEKHEKRTEKGKRNLRGKKGVVAKRDGETPRETLLSTALNIRLPFKLGRVLQNPMGI